MNSREAAEKRETVKWEKRMLNELRVTGYELRLKELGN
jgi:hypothetical protein